MNLVPRPWRQPTIPRDTATAAPAANASPAAQLPLDADLTALIEKDDTLLATLSEQCRTRGLYIVHDGREIKVSPIVEPGWRVVVENDLDSARRAAA